MPKRPNTPQVQATTLVVKHLTDGISSDDQPLTSSDYNGIEIDEWKAAIRKDVEDCFGPEPDNLISVGKPGW